MQKTLKDVAREAGVNVSTVSRALNNSYGVHEDTRRHVLEVAERLNYRINQVARALVTGRSHSIGLIVNDIRNPFFADVARGAEDAAFLAGGDLVLCNSDQNAEKQMRYFDWLLARRVGGFIMNSVTPLTPAQQDRLFGAGVPIVLLNVSSAERRSPGWRFSSVVADNIAGGEMAGNYLIGLGHSNVIHIAGPQTHGNFADRAKGFVKAFRDKSLSKPKVIYTQHAFGAAYQAAKLYLEADRNITAIFAGNDVIAFGCMRAMMERGIRIPEDVSIIGFDNVEISQITSPPLTTIDQPKYETGKAAVEMLLGMMAQGSIREAGHQILGVRLIERQSCQELSRPAASRNATATLLAQDTYSAMDSAEGGSTRGTQRTRSGKLQG